MDGSQSIEGRPVPLDAPGSAAVRPLIPAAMLDAPGLASPAMTGDTPRPSAAEPVFESRAKSAAEKFESFFIAQMLRQMRSGANQFADEDSAARDPLNADMLSLADGLLADRLAGQHAFGIADAILRQLLPKVDDTGLIDRKPA